MQELIRLRSTAHLRPLLEPNPSGAAKLIAAWDGLLVETQVEILHDLDDLGFPAYLTDRIRIKALESPVAYVRYLAARALDLRNDESGLHDELKHRIDNDVSALVRYASLETESSLFDAHLASPDQFFTLPHDARLAKIRSIQRDGEVVAKLVRHAIAQELPARRVSELELFEILSSYAARDSFRTQYASSNRRDGWGEHQDGKDIEALWRLVPDLPEAISHVLIRNLPTKAGFLAEVPKDILDQMSDGQLESLFYRSDVAHNRIRVNTFFGDRRSGVSGAAASYMELTPGQFSRLLKLPTEERIPRLRDLAIVGRRLELPILAAVADQLRTTESDFDYAAFADSQLSKQVASAFQQKRRDQLLELRLYLLARNAAEERTTQNPPLGRLGFLADCVVHGDAWQTYVSISRRWLQRASFPGVEDALPEIPQLSDEAPMQSDRDSERELWCRLERHREEMIDALLGSSDSDRVPMPRHIENLAAHLTSRDREFSGTMLEVLQIVKQQRTAAILQLIVTSILMLLLLLLAGRS